MHGTHKVKLFAFITVTTLSDEQK
jgi:hypothetical protein